MEQGHWNFVAVAKTEEKAGAQAQTVLADLKARIWLLFTCLYASCLPAPVQYKGFKLTTASMAAGFW